MHISPYIRQYRVVYGGGKLLMLTPSTPSPNRRGCPLEADLQLCGRVRPACPMPAPHAHSPRRLSKTDLKLGFSCPAKVYYHQKGYPTTQNDAPLHRYLTLNRWLLRKLARLQCGPGTYISGETIEAEIAQTRRFISENRQQNDWQRGFNLVFATEELLTFGHIVEQCGDRLRLYEVKSKLLHTPEPDFSKSQYRSLARDLAFKVQVVQEAFPWARVEPWLVLPDKAAKNPIEGLRGRFRLVEYATEKPEIVTDLSPEEIRRLQLQRWLPAGEAVEARAEEVAELLAVLRPALGPPLQKLPHPEGIGMHCASCEYRASNAAFPVSGFAQCWGPLATPTPHLTDLVEAGSMHHLNDRVQNGAVVLTDLRKNDLVSETGKFGNRGQRQLRQIKQLRRQTPWIGAHLREQLSAAPFPIAFIDFETATPVVPHHRGQRPYDLLAFQWSLHILDADGRLTHHQWLHPDATPPNLRFAEALLQVLPKRGSLVYFGLHETTVLAGIADELRRTHAHGTGVNVANARLAAALDELVSGERLQLIDLNALVEFGYYHPAMGSRRALKVILPAALQHHCSPQMQAWLETFEEGFSLYETDPHSHPLNPYDQLPDIPDNVPGFQRLQQGSATMLIYETLKFPPPQQSPDQRAALRAALLRYCKLDTLALVLLWRYFLTAPEAG